MDVYGVLENELQQPVGDQVKTDHKLRTQSWYPGGEQSHDHDGDNGYVVETGKNTDHLPQSVRCKLQQGSDHKGKQCDHDTGAARDPK